MKPSEYIALGVRLRPLQAFRASISGDAGCALTAFLDGIAGARVGYVPQAVSRDRILTAVPELRGGGLLACPAGCRSYENVVFGCVIHLNDAHRWARERIGERLDTQVESELEIWQEELREMVTA